MASFPGSVKTFTTLVDGVDSVLAAHQNERGDEITAIETYLTTLLKGYQITASIVSNNLVVALKTAAGSDASAGDAIRQLINGTMRSLTAALSVTVSAGSSVFALGGSRFAASHQQLFVYLGWRASNASMFIGLARHSNGKTYADFSGTATNEKYLAYSGAAPAATDPVKVIGRVGVQNSGSASYNWSLPTGAAVLSEPIFETDWCNYVPATSTSGSLTYTSVSIQIARYKMEYGTVRYEFSIDGTLGGSASNRIGIQLPFEGAQAGITTTPLLGPSWMSDSNVAGQAFLSPGTPDEAHLYKYNLANYGTSGACNLRSTGFYEY